MVYPCKKSYYRKSVFPCGTPFVTLVSRDVTFPMVSPVLVVWWCSVVCLCYCLVPVPEELCAAVARRMSVAPIPTAAGTLPTCSSAASSTSRASAATAANMRAAQRHSAVFWPSRTPLPSQTDGGDLLSAEPHCFRPTPLT